MARLKGLYTRGKKYWFRFTHNGHQHRANLQTEDEGEALKKALEYRANPELAPSETIRIEISAYADEKFRMKEFSVRSHAETIRVLNGFVDFSEIKHIHSITPGEVERWYEWLKSDRDMMRGDKIVTVPGLSEDSAQTYVARLSGFLGYLVGTKLRENAAEKVKLAKFTPKARRIFCQFKERDSLFSACTRADLQFVLYAGFHGGFRKGEIIEMDASWFKLEQDSIHVPVTEFWHPKDKQFRDVPLTKQFRKFILETEPFKSAVAKGSGYMLHPEAKKGKYRYRWDFRRPFDDFVAAQGLDWVTAHVMRKTFGSLLASAGVSLFKIAAWLGDDIRTTQKNYAYLLPKDDEIELAFADRGKKRKKGADSSVILVGKPSTKVWRK